MSKWWDKTWNPITGCSPVSAGCAHCFASRFAKRLAGRYGYPADDPFKVTFHPERLEEPIRWKKPRRIFVCSMGDIFHKDVKPAWIDQVFEVADACPQHTFIMLTKRPENIFEKCYEVTEENGSRELGGGDFCENLWIGVSVENQEAANLRIPLLLDLKKKAWFPGSKVIISVEPMLGPADLRPWLPHLDWVICGGETGPRARPMGNYWAEHLAIDCQKAGVPFFFKGWGPTKASGDFLLGKQWKEFPK